MLHRRRQPGTSGTSSKQLPLPVFLDHASPKQLFYSLSSENSLGFVDSQYHRGVYVHTDQFLRPVEQSWADFILFPAAHDRSLVNIR